MPRGGRRNDTLFFFALSASPIYTVVVFSPEHEEVQMAIKPFVIYKVMLLLAVALLITGCEDTVEFVNTPPSELAISRSKCVIWATGEVTLTGSAEDAEEDPLTFTWSATAGTFTPPDGVGEEVTWRAPDTPGSVVVTLTVTDDIDERSLSIAITVGEEVSTPIYGNVALENQSYPYIITSSQVAVVSVGSHLTIGPGVDVIVDSEFGGLEIRGVLTIDGDAENMVKIGPNSCGGNTATWGGIYIAGGYAEAAIKHANIYAGTGGIQVIEGAIATIDSSNVTDHSGVAVSVVEGASVTVRNCKIWDNGAGVVATNADFTILDSSVRYNGARGVAVTVITDMPFDYDQTIEGCEIANNGIDGIYLVGEASPLIHQCSIFFNGSESAEGHAVRLANYTAADTVHAENNFWGATTKSEIAGLIYDRADNPASIQAYVGFEPWLEQAPLPGSWLHEEAGTRDTRQYHER